MASEVHFVNVYRNVAISTLTGYVVCYEIACFCFVVILDEPVSLPEILLKFIQP